MKQYVDKSALAAEIERQLSAIDNCPKLTDTQIAVLEGNKVVLTKLLSFIGTLEVKEAQEESVSEGLEEAAEDYCKSTLVGSPYVKKNAFKEGAKWANARLKKKPINRVIMKYRIVGKYKNNKLIYKVQENPLFGFPLFWTTVTYWGPEAPHPDLAIPGCCTVNCVFSNSKDAEKCLNALMNKL